jgi:hypothetical protein
MTRCDVGQVVSIDVLPDDVLLAVFDFIVEKDVDPFLYTRSSKKEIEAWQPLVHVCRRWRCVIFGSSRLLDLRLFCTSKTPARDTLDIWPALPLHIHDHQPGYGDLDNIIAVFEHSDRVHVIDLWHIPNSHWENLSATMQVPFPELTFLRLIPKRMPDGEAVLPDSFLGGTAPSLRFLYLSQIPFPGLPRLLLSATYLVDLQLWSIPHSAYISPEAMVTALSALTCLDRLVLRFRFPLSRPDRESRLLPPPTRSVLSVLKRFAFKGDSEYLDDLVAQIDAPRLKKLYIIFFNDIVFDTPQLMRFICRTPTLEPPEKARVTFGGDAASVTLSSPTFRYDLLRVGFSCSELDWQLSLVAQVFTLSLPPLSPLEDLYIYEDLYQPAQWQDSIENSQWLELLLPFKSVKNFYLPKNFAPRIVPALQELVGSRATEVLPNLQNIFLQGLEPSGPIWDGIQQFLTTRQVISDHPIAVYPWDEKEQWSYVSRLINAQPPLFPF